MMTFIYRTTLIALSFFISACTNITTTSPQLLTNENSTALCTPLRLTQGQELIVSLPTSQFSGYYWQMEEDASSILHLTKTQIQKAKNPATRLHRDETLWYFKATQAGHASLSFSYRLEWETKVTDKQKFQCDIIVNTNRP